MKHQGRVFDVQYEDLSWDPSAQMYDRSPSTVDKLRQEGAC